jgi:hypothetical protein
MVIEALKAARDFIENDRQVLAESLTVNGEIVLEDDIDRGAMAEYVKVLAVIDEAIEHALAAPTVQEPVAWMYPDDYERMLTSETFCTVYSVEVGSATRGESSVALYTTPPAQPAPEQYTALEQALTRLQKRYGELEAKVAAEPGQEPVAHLWECLGRWSAYLVANGDQADCAPPSWLVDAVKKATPPAAQPAPVPSTLPDFSPIFDGITKGGAA